MFPALVACGDGPLGPRLRLPAEPLRASPPRIAVEPGDSAWADPATLDALHRAVADGGGTLSSLDEADGLVWAHPSAPGRLGAVLDAQPGLDWIQLPFAGIEAYGPVLDGDHTWTCAKRVYGETTAEHALALLLASLRDLKAFLPAKAWLPDTGRNLHDEPVTIVGAGGIADALMAMLAPFRCPVTIVRRSDRPVPGAARTLPTHRLHEAVADARAVILALALTPETEQLVDADVLAAMGTKAWLVNVARGRHVVTEDLVEALELGVIAGAALDVTHPEPLPARHPLWSLDNCLITPHVANTHEMLRPRLAALVAENVRRRGTGQALLGVIDPELGY